MAQSRTDFKRNNKIGLRNFKEASDFHDIVKTQLVRMLRRKHKDNHNIPIYTEYSPDKPNEEYPDIWMRLKKDIIVWEIQENMSKKWLEQIQENYRDVDLIIVPLKEVKLKWREIIDKYKNPIDSLREILEVYVI